MKLTIILSFASSSILMLSDIADAIAIRNQKGKLTKRTFKKSIADSVDYNMQNNIEPEIANVVVNQLESHGSKSSSSGSQSTTASIITVSAPAGAVTTLASTSIPVLAGIVRKRNRDDGNTNFFVQADLSDYGFDITGLSAVTGAAML